MKKIKLNLGGNMKEMLTREQMKKVIGGYDGKCLTGPCTQTIQGDNGAYVTLSGTCSQAGIFNNFDCYCDLGPNYGFIKPTSNGGVSRCTPGA